MSKKIPGLFITLALFGLTLLLLNCGSSSSRPAGVLYVLSQGENNVGSYAIDLGSGHLSLINTHAAAEATPSTILLDPTGSVAFVLNTGTPNSITSYTTNADGGLSAPTSTPLPVQNSVAMARDAAGTFLFVVSQGSIPLPAAPPCPHAEPNSECPALTVFSMASSSASLTQVGDPIPLDHVPTSVFAVTGPNGTLLYVTGNEDLFSVSDNVISAFNVDGAGSATEQTNSPYATASTPSAVTAVQTAPIGASGGLFVYVTNETTNNINIYHVCTALSATCTAADITVTNNTLEPVGSPVSVGLDPVALTIDPSRNFMYVVNHDSHSVSGFRINPTTGALSALDPATVSTGLDPVAISIHPTGKFLYVSNSGGSNVSGFNVDTTNGALSSATNVTSSAQPAGLVAK